MTTLILGASGATGQHLFAQLLEMGQSVRVMVRPTSKIPTAWEGNDRVTIIKAQITELTTAEMAHHTKNCEAIASCLGHNPTLQGVFGKPRKLVTDAVKLLCAAIEENAPESPVRFVLMNTAGNRNRDANETFSTKHKIVLSLIRLLLPPQSDNEKAAEFLRLQIGQKNQWIEWAVVRPDSLTDQDQVTKYEVFESPTRDALFDPRKTSRINVAHFMARLIADIDLWKKWKGKMPVIYNAGDEEWGDAKS